jgi:sugar/nucleoside kinase (ribokinase family)
MTKLNAHCARAFIISDPNGEQFIAFYPGPEVTHDSWEAHLNSQDIASSQIVICAPFPQRFMVSSLHYMTRVNPKALRIWSPGQYADSLDAGAVEELSPLWDVLIGNEYEVEYLVSIDPKLMNKKTVVVTAGPRPIRVYMAHGGTRTFPVINMTDASADPTGAGDAFVAGFAVTVSQHISLENKGAWIGHINEAVKNGVRSAQRCLAHVGSQNYHRSKT